MTVHLEGLADLQWLYVAWLGLSATCLLVTLAMIAAARRPSPTPTVAPAQHVRFRHLAGHAR